MLKIGKPFIKEHNDKTRLYCDLILNDNEPYSLWYEVDNEYGRFLCDDRIDGIVVNVLLYCMERGVDIYSDCPISQKLYYQLTTYLIPSISKNIKKYQSIKITAPFCETEFDCANAVGTGLSGGIDSFYSIAKHINCDSPNFNLTHLTFFNAGASGNYGGDTARQLFQERIDYVKNFATEHHLKLVTVDTNINEFLQQIHYYTHTFRSLAIPLILQKLFGVYYYSSSRSFFDFHFSMVPGSYELLSLQCLSTESLTFYSCGGETSGRLEKTEVVSEFAPSYKYLNVCIKESSNCGRCEKCVRTMLGLYALGKLELYSDVFDLSDFRKNLKKHLAFMLSQHKNGTYREIRAALKQNKIKIPLSSYFLAFFKITVRKFKNNKIIRKLFRKPNADI